MKMQKINGRSASSKEGLRERPSEITSDYWVYAQSKNNYPQSTEDCGKWLIFVPIKDLDATWEKISKATEEGMLGGSSKCGTAKQNPNATDPDTKVICVYTYNAKDKDDVARVAWELFRLGVVGTVLNYKKDKTTLDGKYSIMGNQKVSTYSIHISFFKDKSKEEFIRLFKEKYS